MKDIIPIPPEKYEAIRRIGQQRLDLMAIIENARVMLLGLPTSKQLAMDHNLPLNTVRQLLRGKGYGGRRLVKNVSASRGPRDE